MPLPRLSDKKSRDGLVTIGAMRHRVTIEEMKLEMWAHVSVGRSAAGTQAEFTSHYIPGVRAGMSVTYEGMPFRITRVIELGNNEQMKLFAEA